MPNIHILDTPGKSSILDYHVNLYKDDKFVQCYRFQGYSGHAMMDEIKILSESFPASQGYRFEY